MSCDRGKRCAFARRLRRETLRITLSEIILPSAIGFKAASGPLHVTPASPPENTSCSVAEYRFSTAKPRSVTRRRPSWMRSRSIDAVHGVDDTRGHRPSRLGPGTGDPTGAACRPRRTRARGETPGPTVCMDGETSVSTFHSLRGSMQEPDGGVWLGCRSCDHPAAQPSTAPLRSSTSSATTERGGYFCVYPI